MSYAEKARPACETEILRKPRTVHTSPAGRSPNLVSLLLIPPGSTAGAPPGRAKAAPHRPAHPAQRSKPQRPAFLPVPHKAGPEPSAGQKWHAGSAGALHEQTARPCPSLLCLGAARPGACPCAVSPGSQQGAQMPRGAGRKGLTNGLRPTSEQQETPCEPGPARHPGPGDHSVEERVSSPQRRQPSSAHWSWTLALLALRDRCVPC